MVALHHNGQRNVLPTGWDDAGPNAWSMLRALARYPHGAGKLTAIRYVTGLSKSEFRQFTEEDIAALCVGLPWLDAGELARPIRVSFLHRLRRYYWATHRFENGTCLGYALADEFFEKAISGKGDSEFAARCLVAVLARPNRRLIRQAVTSREEAERYARAMKRLAPEWLLQGLFYWSSTRRAIDGLYGDYLFRPSPLDKAPSGPIPNFGWWSTYMDVAEAGAFGDVNQVHAAQFHDVCAWLVRKEAIRRAQQIDIENLKNKST